jgi:hypothetical protein
VAVSAGVQASQGTAGINSDGQDVQDMDMNGIPFILSILLCQVHAIAMGLRGQYWTTKVAKDTKNDQTTDRSIDSARGGDAATGGGISVSSIRATVQVVLVIFTNH